MTDAAKLRALADAATTGPWFGPRITDAWPPGEWGVYAADDDGTPIPHAIIARMARDDDSDNAAFIDEQRNNAAFIAAANPQTVLAILDEAVALRARIDHACMLERELRRELDAMIAARNEACDIAETTLKLRGDFYGRHNKLGSDRITELRKMGSP